MKLRELAIDTSVITSMDRIFVKDLRRIDELMLLLDEGFQSSETLVEKVVVCKHWIFLTVKNNRLFRSRTIESILPLAGRF